MQLVLREKVKHVSQGAVVSFPFQFLSGAMRGRFHPRDHQLYVAGMKGWVTNAIKDGSLQRVRFTGTPIHLPVALHNHNNGVSITFSQHLNEQIATDVRNYSVEQWNYRWTRNYGSAHYSVENPKRKGQDEVEILAAELSADGKTVFLEIEDIQPVMQMKINLNIKAADGSPVKLVIHNTINKLGKGK